MKKLKFILRFKYIHSIWLLCFFLFNLPISAQIIVGASQPNLYLGTLKGKKVGLVVNQTSVVGKEHLVDFLLKNKINITCIFAPEHGFRGDHSAGEKVKTTVDSKTKLPVFSLYGNYKKPKEEQLKNLDVVVFDIQDVGARFYTYISTLHYMMEACAEQNKTLLILDRPNPNGHYVDGPILDTAYKSFVGMHPVPVVHGCTIGEYAQMINGEGWLKNGITCKIIVVKVKNYSHQSTYTLLIKPSPNLPTMNSIYLYPSLCFFEGTNYSIGRGTNKPFERVGKPLCTIGTDTFTPRNIPGVAENPPFEGKACKGILLSDYGQNIAPFEGKINLYWLIDLYKNDTNKDKFFTPFFEKLAGTNLLRQQIMEGKTEDEIRKTWQSGLKKYRATRHKYLLYSDKE
jgi:uncharacterized protein YbbC (DUF1343 family)